MKGQLAITIVLILGLIAFNSCNDSGDVLQLQNGIWIKNVTIISPETEDIEPYVGHVIIDNNSIKHVGVEKPRLSGDFKAVEASGKYIIPGLIDSHVHLGYVAGLSTRLARQHKKIAESYFNQLPKSYLYFGYTTLIDPNNFNPDLIAQIQNSEVRPDIYTCGQQVKVMNDVFMAEDTQEDRYKYYPEFLNDHYNKNVILPDSINLGKHSVAHIVSKIAREQNGICIKTNYEDGYGGTEKMTWELPSLQIIKDIVAEAKTENVPVLLHANSYDAQKFGYEANVDIIAHGMWHWGLLEDYINVKDLPETHKQLLINIANKKIGYQPTFRVIAGQKDVFNSDFIDDKNLVNVLPKNLLEWLKTKEGLWQKKRIYKYGGNFFNENSSDEEIQELMQLILDKITVSTELLASNNANLLFSTDTPAMNSHSNPPGYNGFLEMKEWLNVGISLEQILKSATINNAKEFNLYDLYGSIEKNKRANLVLMNQNPLENIDAYNDIYKVVINGVIHNRGDLSAKQD